MADGLGPLGDCSHVHCRPVVENHIDTLVRQLSDSGVRPAATESQPATQTMTDRQVIDQRDELARIIRDGSLGRPASNIEAMELHDPWINDHALPLAEYSEVRQEIDRRVAARALFCQTDPPQDLLEQIGSRSESPDPQAWDSSSTRGRHHRSCGSPHRTVA